MAKVERADIRADVDVRFTGRDNEVTKGYPKYENGSIFINPSTRFHSIPQVIWDFYIGGYQVLNKWLKDRKGRTLSEEDIEHHTKVVKALHETAQIMSEIDEVIEAHGGWPLAGSVKEEQQTGS